MGDKITMGAGSKARKRDWVYTRSFIGPRHTHLSAAIFGVSGFSDPEEAAWYEDSVHYLNARTVFERVVRSTLTDPLFERLKAEGITVERLDLPEVSTIPPESQEKLIDILRTAGLPTEKDDHPLRRIINAFYGSYEGRRVAQQMGRGSVVAIVNPSLIFDDKFCEELDKTGLLYVMMTPEHEFRSVAGKGACGYMGKPWHPCNLQLE